MDQAFSYWVSEPIDSVVLVRCEISGNDVSSSTTTISPVTLSTSVATTTPIFTTTTALTESLIPTIATTTSAPTTTNAALCPIIPPPRDNTVGYTFSEQVAYCTSAMGGIGSYCKCYMSFPGRVCQSTILDIRNTCSCAVMCGIDTSGVSNLYGPNLSTTMLSNKVVSLQFNVTSNKTMSELVSILRNPVAALNFTNSVATNGSITSRMTSFNYVPAELNKAVSPSGDFVVNVYTDIALDVGGTVADSRIFGDSFICDTLKNALDLLPKGNCETSVVVPSVASTDPMVPITVRVKLGFNHVSADTTASYQNQLVNFLILDFNEKEVIPNGLATRLGLAVTYDPRYVPIVWSSVVDLIAPPKGGVTPSFTQKILPYLVSAGSVLLLVAVAFVLYLNRARIKLCLGNICSDPNNGRYPTVLGPSSLIHRGKSEVRETPDTLTNVDIDEFDADMIRWGFD